MCNERKNVLQTPAGAERGTENKEEERKQKTETKNENNSH
jgi:hypothetical protein